MSHASMGEEEARRMLEKIEKTAVADGDSDLEVTLRSLFLFHWWYAVYKVGEF